MGTNNTAVNYAAIDEYAPSRSTLVSRNITVLGRRTSVRLEPEMWTALRDIARRENCSIHDLSSLIQLRKNPDTSLTAAIRVFLMLYYRASSTEEGHMRGGHGDFRRMLVRARLTLESLRAFKRSPNKKQASRAATTAVGNADEDARESAEENTEDHSGESNRENAEETPTPRIGRGIGRAC